MQLRELGRTGREERTAERASLLVVELELEAGHQIGSSKSGRRVGP